MKFLILGDAHGEWTHMNVTISRAIREHPDITHIVQVGDLGYGWPGGKPFKASRSFFSEAEMAVYNAAVKLWIDGNHENFDRLDQDNGASWPDWRHMSRGSVLEIEGKRIMFFGGASSIDKADRTPHVSWWPQESITYGQVRRAMEDDGPIDAMFSHEHPTAFPYSDTRYDNNIFGRSDKDLLDALRQHFKPKVWFFGHHHFGDTGIVAGTEWVCCPIIEARQYTIWDGETIRRVW
jgi:predicted phosphodiesterase